MNGAVQITGWHPNWKQIATLKAILAATDCGLAKAKGIVSAALMGEQPSLDVDGDLQAASLAKELADLGAIVACNGVIYDSYLGEERGIPYRQEAVGTMQTKAASDGDTYAGRVTAGIVPQRFDLSMPLTGGLDFRVAATVINRDGPNVVFKIDCDDPEEREFWRAELQDAEVDIHRPRSRA